MARRYLFIAEKPSLMREVQSCYFNHRKDIVAKVGEIDFMALAGHVCENYSPDDYEIWADRGWREIDYPMIPQKWLVKIIPDARKRKIVSEIQKCQKEYDGIIVGTDSDQEGYGIYHMLEQYLKLEKRHALRFVEHSLTDSEIFQSLMTMTDFHSDPVHQRFVQAFTLRSRADWLFGMNCTRKASVRRNAKTNIGRVKSEVIKLVYDNSRAIDEFRPQTFFTNVANYGTFQAVETLEDGTPARYASMQGIPSLPLEGKITRKEGKKARVKAPKLFDLTSAQAEAGRLFGFSPAKTLEVIQSLYEKHKVISYPRTECRFVSSEKAKEFPMMLNHMSAFPELAEHAKRVKESRFAELMSDRNIVNDREVQKESHDALLPTGRRPDPSAMTREERDVCVMIFRRLLAHLLEPGKEKRTRLSIAHGDRLFIAKGRQVVDQGWRVLYAESGDSIIPEVNEGESIFAEEFIARKGTTRPPRRYTQASLAEAMQNIASLVKDPELRKSLAESKGIGTPARRAPIILSTIKSGFVEEHKDGLYISDSGKAYIDSIGNLSIVKPEFAAQMDMDIKRVQRGEAAFEDVYRTILERLQHTMDDIDRTIRTESLSAVTSVKCPLCGDQLVRDNRFFRCPGRDFIVGRRIAGTEITEAMLGDLVNGVVVGPMSFTSKKGNPFTARLFMENDGKISFDYSSGIACPKCGKDLDVNRGGAFCRECGFRLFRNVQKNVPLNDDQLRTLISGGIVKDARLRKKDGSPMTADLSLEMQPDGTGKVKFIFPNSGFRKRTH